MALLGGSAAWPAPAAAAGLRRQPATLPIEHVIISCQENRSFDHYFGFAPQVQAAGFGPRADYSQPDGNGGTVIPFEFTALSTDDIGHSWSAVHGEWNAGAMDGFFTTDGNAAMGYYTAKELPFYYSLLDEFTLCGNYFCSLLGPTWPNRFYFAAGTSGGITTNGVWGFGVFDYPIILDLLDAADVSWKIYNMPAERRFSFEGFQLDLASGRLSSGTGPIALAPKALAVLEYLAARPGQLISKEELLGAMCSRPSQLLPSRTGSGSSSCCGPDLVP